MKRYILSLGESIGYKHPHPERTAKRSLGFDIEYQVWPNRKAMALSVRMQQKRGPLFNPRQWEPLIPLSDGEGY